VIPKYFTTNRNYSRNNHKIIGAKTKQKGKDEKRTCINTASELFFVVAEGVKFDEADTIIYVIIDGKAPIFVGIATNDESEDSVHAPKTTAPPKSMCTLSRTPLSPPVKFAQAEAKYSSQSLVENVSAVQRTHRTTFRLSQPANTCA
jgi:hypothetical protein